MQLVPIIPQPTVGIKEPLAVNAVAKVKAVKPVAETTAPPVVIYAHGEQVRVIKGRVESDKRQSAEQPERRSVCRRIAHRSILEELRSSVDRRKHHQRITDLQLHIDEEA
ncbi:MAG: hypothetical protein B7Y56_01820 [Gallionellales bacterium 35-53-114]|jgi:hypothetical protein|nr:MAG: hypothetical protein B7Y56_01820 [Gallionellales bacterium 35-53-114]OYZ64363.1 MAG: hypothetical protein B7Y04_05600 [Gallionellales bacterium 24-53-125]OZB10328.1 MAG: hypothetical protein B7X61_02105 [Gallionellales bacterium 39-52-133]HQS56932.1 hypothetical protein [Gallionellaceae bacterium]HQS75284.1 hypothetical protein [Gallionellaceae bacterium]